jgi:hypothetical protein
MKRLAALLVPILFTAGLLIYALAGIDLGAFWTTLLDAQLWVIAPFLVLLTLFCLSNAQRWALILRPFGRYSTRDVAPSMMIGLAGNNVLPLRIGEIIRTVIFAKEFGRSRSGVLMTLVVERALDLVGILLVFATGVILVGDVPSGFKVSLFLALAGIAALMLSLILFARFPQVPFGIWTRASRHLPTRIAKRGDTYLAELAKGLESLAMPPAALALLLYSLLRWFIAAAMAWLSVASYGVTLPAGLAMLVIGVTAVAVSMPSVPGFIGPVQAAFVFALTPFGVTQEVALAASILFLIGQWIPVTLTGALYFLSRHYSYRQIRREAASMEDA